MEKEIESLALEKEVMPDEQKQNRIITILETGSWEVMFDLEENVKVEESQKKSFLDKLADDKIDDEKVENFLINIPKPLDEQDKNLNILAEMYDKIEKNQDIRKMIAKITRGSEQESKNIKPKDIQIFLATYPNPMTFDKDMQKFFGKVEQKYSQEYRKKFEGTLDLDTFMHTLYGKQQEYYEQFKLLKKDAKEKPLETKVETQEEMLEKELKTEFENIFKNLQGESKTLNLAILNNPEYQNLRNQNENIRTIAKRFRTVQENPKELMAKFKTLEEETLSRLIA